jgi:hypothetical protein
MTLITYIFLSQMLNNMINNLRPFSDFLPNQLNEFIQVESLRLLFTSFGLALLAARHLLILTLPGEGSLAML